MKKILLVLLLSFVCFDLFAAFFPKSFSASIEQIHKSVTSGKERVSKGKIAYQYPTSLRFEIISPDPLIFVSNPKKSWYYSPPFIEGEQGEVTVRSTSSMPLVKFLDMLRQGLKSNKQYSVKKLKTGYQLLFSKQTAKKVQVQSATLSFGKKTSGNFKDLKEIQLIYIDKKKITLKLYNINDQAQFKKSYFVFKIPAGTKVSH